MALADGAAPDPVVTRVFDRGFALDLVPGEAAMDYQFDPTDLADPSTAAAPLTAEDLRDERLLQIVTQAMPDEAVNVLVWKCLGYQFVAGRWDSTQVFPKFREQYPQPPDFLGVTRTYTQAVDEPTLLAVTRLHRSVPPPYVAALKSAFRPLGWKGYQLEELDPNRRRRAMVTQWLLYYRAELFGIPLEELQRRRAERAGGSASGP